jgi:RNA polymerase sigma-70 factor (ECF subfamily)
MGDAASSCSNAEAVGSCAENDPVCDIQALLAEHFSFVWRLARRLGLSPTDADDATQQVFMIASSKLARIAPDRARAFLYGTTIRVVSQCRRGIRRRREVLGQPADVPELPGQAPDELVDLRRAYRLVDELLDGLPDQLRRVLVLADIQQLEVAEIALLERIPIGTAASRLRRARERFRGLLARSEHRNPFRGRP